MTYDLKRGVLMFPLMASVALSACVSQSSYDALQAQYQQAQQLIPMLSRARQTRLMGSPIFWLSMSAMNSPV